MSSAEIRWGSLNKEPPTLALTVSQGCVPIFQLYECQECAHWCASDPRNKGPGFVISRMRPGWTCQSNYSGLQMLEGYLARHCCPQGLFPASLLGFLFQLGLFLLFRLDEHQSLQVTVHEVPSGCFDWRLREEGIWRWEIRKFHKLDLIKYLPN